MAATLYTTAQVAEKLETTPRTLRKFLRADAAERGTETPGKGSRYSITGKEVAPLKKRFTAWSAAQAEAKAAKAEVAEVEADDMTVEVDATDEELAALEAELDS